jgi:hypothetical protein
MLAASIDAGEHWEALVETSAPGMSGRGNGKMSFWRFGMLSHRFASFVISPYPDDGSM